MLIFFFILILLIFVLRLTVVNEYIEKYSQKREHEKKYDDVMRQWDEIPEVALHIDRIFAEYGLITPLEYLALFYREREEIYESLKSLVKLLKHLHRILWNYVNRLKRCDSIRNILRNHIKSIDDEELIIAVSRK